MYVWKNYFRYQNDTMANLMFDTQLPKNQYVRFNSLIERQNLKYYLFTTSLHTVGFMYMSYFFRHRRLTLAPVLAISSAYYFFFTKSNNMAYKVIVDRQVINLARQL